MTGWYFSLGCFAGSVWTLAVTRGRLPKMPKLRRPSLGAKYVQFMVTDTGDRKIHVIKEIRAATRYGLKEAKDASEGVPFTVSKDVAATLKPALDCLGVSVLTRPVRRAA